MYGDVVVEETGDFIRKIGRETRKIYSPITQCERHMQVIKVLRKSTKGIVSQHFLEKYFETNYIPVVVMANPSGKINVRNAPKDIKHKIIGVDQLVRFIKNQNDSKEMSSERDIKALADYFLSVQKENPRKYMEKYRRLIEEIPTSIEPIVEEVIPEQISEDVKKICSRCGSEMVPRIAKRGENIGKTFWGCSRYPKCRYMEE